MADEKRMCEICLKESVGLLAVVPGTADAGAHPKCLFNKLVEIGGRPDIGLFPEMLTSGFLAALESIAEDPTRGRDEGENVRSMEFE